MTFNHNVNITITHKTGTVDPPEILRALEILGSQISSIIKQGESLMALSQAQLDAIAKSAEELKTQLLDAVKKELGEVAAQIQKLRDQIASGGTVSDADLAQVLGAFSGVAPAVQDAIDKISVDDGGDDKPTV